MTIDRETFFPLLVVVALGAGMIWAFLRTV
jgi:hypothetical protein